MQVFFKKLLESSMNLMIEISSEAVGKYPKPMAETYMLLRNFIKIKTPLFYLLLYQENGSVIFKRSGI